MRKTPPNLHECFLLPPITPSYTPPRNHNRYMSQFSIHRAAQEGQPGLVRKLLSDKPTLISSVDDVRPPPSVVLFLLLPLLTRLISSNTRTVARLYTGQRAQPAWSS